jgi:hypothetical protein
MPDSAGLPADFLVSLLAVPCLPALNEALGMFADMNCIEPELAAAILDGIFGGMVAYYFELQIRLAVNICANLVIDEATDFRAVQGAFLRRFSTDIPGVEQYAEFVVTARLAEFVDRSPAMLWHLVQAARDV